MTIDGRGVPPQPGNFMWVGWFLLQVKNEVGLGGTQLKWKCSPTSAANLPLDFTEGGEGRGERRVVGLKSGKWSHVPQMSNSDSFAKFGHCVWQWVPARSYSFCPFQLVAVQMWDLSRPSPFVGKLMWKGTNRNEKRQFFTFAAAFKSGSAKSK